MKRLLAIFLCLCSLAVALAGCKKEPAPAPLDEISGVWEAEADYATIIKAAINQQGDKALDKSLELGEFKVRIQYTFDAEGSYQRKRLKEFSEADLAALKTALKAGYITYYENALGEEILQGRSVEAYLKQKGLSLDGKIEDITEQILPQVFEGIDRSGQYKIEKNGEILFSTLPQSIPDGNNRWLYTLEGDALKINAAEATAGEETLSFPLTFYKVN